MFRIFGPPGTGKTEVAKIMGKIFSTMGVLPKNVFRKATRADLIAGYLGQTALKTKDLIITEMPNYNCEKDMEKYFKTEDLNVTEITNSRASAD